MLKEDGELDVAPPDQTMQSQDLMRMLDRIRELSESGARDAAREALAQTGKCAVVNVWVDPDEYAPGTKAQTMYK